MASEYSVNISLDTKKAEDESGAKMFTAADLPSLRREIPMSILIDLMTKMQSMGEEESPYAVNS